MSRSFSVAKPQCARLTRIQVRWSWSSNPDLPESSLRVRRFPASRSRPIRAQLLLVDLAHRSQRQFLGKGDSFRDRDLRDDAFLDVGRYVQTNVFLNDPADVIGFENDKRQRSFTPLHVLDTDDGGAPDAFLLHDDVLERDRRNPLAAALHDILQAV